MRPLAFATVLLGLPAQVSAKTVSSGRLIVVPAAAVRAMIEAEPRLGLPFLDYALNEVRELTIEAVQLKLRSAAQRLAEYLVGLIEDPQLLPARFVLPYEKRFLAGKIGCTQENLSRAFAALRRVGVETHQSVVIVPDVGALRAFARLVEPREGWPVFPSRGGTGSAAIGATIAFGLLEALACAHAAAPLF